MSTDRVKTHRATKSRPPGRSWHRGLDRQSVIDEALQILDAEGRPALTMRRLAEALGVEAASLYAHVGSKEDLVDAVLDQVLDAIPLPEPGPDPRAQLIAGFMSYRAGLLAHPAVVPMINERARTSPSQVRLITRSIELLEESGLSTRAAVDAQVTIVAFVLGFILQEVGRSAAAPREVLEASPVLRRALTTLAERSVDDRFAVGIELILDGVDAGRGRARRG